MHLRRDHIHNGGFEPYQEHPPPHAQLSLGVQAHLTHIAQPEAHTSAPGLGLGLALGELRSKAPRPACRDALNASLHPA